MPHFSSYRLSNQGLSCCPKTQSWLVLCELNVSPLYFSMYKPGRTLCSKLNLATPLGCSLTPGLWTGSKLLLPALLFARYALCQMCSLPDVPISCVCCLRAASWCHKQAEWLLSSLSCTLLGCFNGLFHIAVPGVFHLFGKVQ